MMKNKYLLPAFVWLGLACISSASAELPAGSDLIEKCVLQQFAQADDNLTIAQIKQICQQQQAAAVEENVVSADADLGAISKRLKRERNMQFSPFVLTPHKMNYILPVYSTNAINKDVYATFSGYEDNLEDLETKFQISYKVPLNPNQILVEGDALYLGFTLQAWWQTYAENISKPFRETNYNPELFYLMPLEWQPFGGNTGFVLGFEHISNGRSQILSRSWNRVYAHLLFEKNNFAFSFKPWVRLNEGRKEFELDPDGDDNPDILDYMGHFEVAMAYQWGDKELNFIGRENFATNRGFAELGFTFPLWGKLKGYATASNGYGESLIDYNYRQTRFGIGIALNDLL